MPDDATIVEPPPVNQRLWLRRLRIAVSVFFGLLTVLLVVLWVRSYWWVEAFRVQLIGKYYLGAASSPGAVGSAIHSNGPLKEWCGFSRSDTEKWLASVRQDALPNFSRVWGTFYIERYGFMVPDWLAIIAVVMLATIPWLPWRFSLRALLIVMTLVAVLLGLVVWAKQICAGAECNEAAIVRFFAS